MPDTISVQEVELLCKLDIYFILNTYIKKSKLYVLLLNRIHRTAERLFAIKPQRNKNVKLTLLQHIIKITRNKIYYTWDIRKILQIVPFCSCIHSCCSCKEVFFFFLVSFSQNIPSSH